MVQVIELGGASGAPEIVQVKRELDPIPRHGGDGRPWIWNEDADPEAVKKWEDSGREKYKPTKMGAWYTRTTTFIDAFDDKTNLAKYQSRKTALGLSMDEGLLTKVRNLEDPDGSDKSKLDGLVKQAQNKADADLASLRGTAFHLLAENHNAGKDPGFIPPELEPAFKAYVEIMDGFEVVAVETFVVIDGFKVGGTFDILAITPDGRLVIMDLKTGSVWGMGKFARQLGGYSRGKVYCPYTFKRTPLEWNGQPVDTSLGYVVHVPLKDGEIGNAAMLPVDLDKGWAEWPLCLEVREARKTKHDLPPLRVVQV